LSSYDAVVLLIILAFAALFYSFPMLELHIDASRQAMSGIFWHDVIRNVVLTGRFDNHQEFVATYLKQYESDFFYYPIFYELVLGSSFLFFGINEAVFYSTVLLFALVSILATYLLASRLYDKRVGVISSLFLASSHALLAYTKSGEIDVPATAMVTVSILTFLKAKADKRWRYSILAGIMVGLSFMTKPTTAIVMAPLAVFLFLKFLQSRDKKIGTLVISKELEKRNIRKQLRKFGVLLVPAAVLGSIQTYIWTRSGEMSSWLWAFSGSPVIPFPWHVYFSWILTEYLSPVVVSLFVVGFVFSLRRRNSSDVFLLTWFAIFILFATAGSNRIPRYLFTLVPCLSIVAAEGLLSLYDLVKEKMETHGRRPIRNVLKTFFIFLIVLGVLNSAVLIRNSSYRSWADLPNIDESPMDGVAKFLAEKPSVICILPDDTGWAILQLMGALPYSGLTLEFHVLKYDRQRVTNFHSSLYSAIILENMTNEMFLKSLDWLSDNYGGKTVYVVIPNVYNWSQEFLEVLEHPESLEYLEIIKSLVLGSTQWSVRAYLEPYQRIYSYIESHSELIPLVKVFKGGGLEIRVYQRIKGVF